ncbi:MAG TPA: hypothetical protein VNM92_16490 [Thermoanaerobaculia bacterium]|nr:hypothetical protein [Thermoanaerobaculia bacterium]
MKPGRVRGKLDLRAFSVLASMLSIFAPPPATAQQLGASSRAGLEVRINDGQPLFAEGTNIVISGTTAAGAPATATIRIGSATVTTPVVGGRFSLQWPTRLDDGSYQIEVTVSESGGRTETATGVLGVQPRLSQPERTGRLPRQPVFTPPPEYAPPPEQPQPGDYQEMTDRWRIAPPPYELDEAARGRQIGGDPRATTDPYNRNILKGDYPIIGSDIFFVFTGISDTLGESRTLPTPSGASSKRPTSFRFFGDENQNFLNQNLVLSFELFQGLTAYQPIKQRLRATLIGNLSHVRVRENALVKPDVRRGTERTDGRGSIQELFYERKLRDLSPNFDFLSVRIGSQPFVSDFRGFVFSDTTPGIRLFGNYESNRVQFNLAFFDRLEKDTNSGLNVNNERRGQQVVVANYYKQDAIFPGYTTQFSFHYMHDEPDFKFDRNGNLVRPAPVGSFTPHEINAFYLGWAGLGHIGRYNIDHALYYVVGRDTLNPIAGRDPALRGKDAVDIGAGMAAIEVSYDRDWLRPRLALFYSQGDRNPRDRHARGFDSIFDNPNFAGGGFSFFNRLGIRMAGAGVALVERGSLIPSLRSSKDQGQPQFVNPGLQLFSAGLDVDVTPRLKAIFTGNYLRFDSPRAIEAILSQDGIRNEIGYDLSAGLRYRPFLNNNAVFVGGIAGLLPGAGFKDIYEDDTPLYHFFSNIILTF